MAEITQLKPLKDSDPFADLDELGIDMDTIEIVGSDSKASPDALWGKALSEELDRDEEKDDDAADEERDGDGPSTPGTEPGTATEPPTNAAPKPAESVQPEPDAVATEDPREFIAAIGSGTDADVADRREQAIRHLTERFPEPAPKVAPEPVPAVVEPDPDGPPPNARVMTYDPETGKPESWFQPAPEAAQEAPRRRGRPRKIIGAPEPRDGQDTSPEPPNWDDPDRGRDYQMGVGWGPEVRGTFGPSPDFGRALEISRVGEIETRPSVNVTLNITHFHGNAEAVTELVKGLSAALASMLDKPSTPEL
jgi:hypothetical protein